MLNFLIFCSFGEINKIKQINITFIERVIQNLKSQRFVNFTRKAEIHKWFVLRNYFSDNRAWLARIV